jgi:uncharacterized phage protein (TIGR01671 family)
MWDGFANKYFDEETDPLFENVYECMKQQIFYNSGNHLYGKLAYNHAKDGRVFEQCTGLKDKNGKLIYEGDIVAPVWYDGSMGSKAVVKYGEFNCSCCDGVYGWYFDNGDIRGVEDYEVIGNIHENPDLLENKNE